MNALKTRVARPVALSSVDATLAASLADDIMAGLDAWRIPLAPWHTLFETHRKSHTVNRRCVLTIMADVNDTQGRTDAEHAEHVDRLMALHAQDAPEHSAYKNDFSHVNPSDINTVLSLIEFAKEHTSVY